MDLRPEYEGKIALVTGAAGFVGSHLVDRLVDLGADVRALDDLSDGESDNLSRSADRIRFHRHSIVQPDGLDEILHGCDYVFHLGANASVPRSAEKPEYDFAANVIGTHHVMESFRRTGARRIIFTSSAAVYGEPVEEPMTEEHPLLPKSPYGGSKLAGEFLLDAYARCFDYDHRRLRLFNTYGPRQRKYVAFDLLEKLRKDSKRLEILGDGEQVRDYNYVSDTVAAILLVGCHPEARGGVFNVSGMNPINIKQLAQLLVEALEIDAPEVSYTGQSWPGDIMRMLGDTKRLTALGYRPEEGLRDGLAKLVAWHREEYPW